MKAFCAIFGLLLVALVSADNSTTTVQPVTSTDTPTTTSKPTPAPTPNEKVSFEFFNGKNLEALGEFEAVLQLTPFNTSKPLVVTLDNSTIISKETSSYKDSKITVTFNVNGVVYQNLTFVIEKKNETYSLNQINVAWTFNKTTDYKGHWNESLFNVTADHSFLCLEAQHFDFAVTPNDTSKISLDLKNFKLDAFRNTNSTVYRTPTECTLDMKKSDFVPLAVGASLIALVLIVLVAFLIGRRRSRRLAYESV